MFRHTRYINRSSPLSCRFLDDVLSSIPDVGNSSYYKYGPNNNRSILYVQQRALRTDRFYEFKVVLTNLVDTTRQYTGFAVAQIQEIDSVLIAIE